MSSRSGSRRRRVAGFVAIAAGAMSLAACPPVDTPPPVTTTITTTTIAPDDDQSTWSTAVVPLPNNGLASAPTRGVVLLSVDTSVPEIGNHVVEMDPRTGAIGRRLQLTGGPGQIEVARDGSRAYVALQTSPVVVEIDLSTFSEARRFGLGGDPTSGPYVAADLAVHPTDSSLVAVLRRPAVSSSFDADRVVIYDDGVPRPLMTSPGGPSRIAWSDDAGTLYGVRFGAFYEMSVSLDGVTVTRGTTFLTAEHPEFEYAGGRAHVTTGQVVDPSTGAVVGLYNTGGAIEVDPTIRTAFLLRNGELSGHDTDTLVRSWTMTVPVQGARDLVRVDRGLVAAGPSSVVLIGAGVSVSGYVAPVAPASVVRPSPVRTVSLAVNDIVASPDGSTLFAVVRQDASRYPGHVVAIDVAANAVVRRLDVGSNPSHLAVTDDGSRLLVAHAWASTVTEVRTSDLSIVRSVPLAPDTQAGDIVARPGTVSSFVVQLGGCCGTTDVAVVQDGAFLPDRAALDGGLGPMAFAGDPSRLYGSDSDALLTMDVDENGVRLLSTARRLSPAGISGLVGSGGVLYSARGSVIDPTAPRALGAVGRGIPVVVAGRDRLLSVDGSTIHEFDLDGLWSAGSTSLPSGLPIAATLVGDRVAIATHGGSIHFLRLSESSYPTRLRCCGTGERTIGDAARPR